jgi:hypothetical protein
VIWRVGDSEDDVDAALAANAIANAILRVLSFARADDRRFSGPYSSPRTGVLKSQRGLQSMSLEADGQDIVIKFNTRTLNRTSE